MRHKDPSNHIKNNQEKVINRGHLDSLSKHFSFNEKKVVKELSHELKTYISLENLDDKRHERKEFNQQVKNYRKAKAGYKNMQVLMGLAQRHL